MYIYICLFIHSRENGGKGLRDPEWAISPCQGVPFVILNYFLLIKRSRKVLGAMGYNRQFEHSNRELLALHICREIAVFAVHAGPGGPRGVPGGSQGCARGSQKRPLGPQGRAQGIPGIPGCSRAIAGTPGIFFIKVIPQYNSMISFRNMIQ